MDFWQKWPFFDTFWPKKSPILNFPTGTITHTHTTRNLGEDFRKFSAKTNDKN